LLTIYIYENPHAERINGTIKNSYLKGYHPISFKDLTKKLNKAVYMYNYEKSHSSISHYTPVAFERKLDKELVTLN
jgi:transposase InsO family protein